MLRNRQRTSAARGKNCNFLKRRASGVWLCASVLKARRRNEPLSPLQIQLFKKAQALSPGKEA